MFFKLKEVSSGSVDYIIVGLGNLGKEYELTRHNVGFMVIDRLAEKCGCDVKKSKFKSLYGNTTISGAKCLLVKPQTFMNNSGETVRDIASFYKVAPERIIVIFDDVSLEVGKLRIRRKGSDGGHNGIKSIINLTASDNYPRIKIGVGANPHPDYRLADWVLSNFKKEEADLLKEAIENACSAIELMVNEKTDMAMNRFNS